MACEILWLVNETSRLLSRPSMQTPVASVLVLSQWPARQTWAEPHFFLTTIVSSLLDMLDQKKNEDVPVSPILSYKPSALQQEKLYIYIQKRYY